VNHSGNAKSIATSDTVVAPVVASAVAVCSTVSVASSIGASMPGHNDRWPAAVYAVSFLRSGVGLIVSAAVVMAVLAKVPGAHFGQREVCAATVDAET